MAFGSPAALTASELHSLRLQNQRSLAAHGVPASWGCFLPALPGGRLLEFSLAVRPPRAASAPRRFLPCPGNQKLPDLRISRARRSCSSLRVPDPRPPRSLCIFRHSGACFPRSVTSVWAAGRQRLPAPVYCLWLVTSFYCRADSLNQFI